MTHEILGHVKCPMCGGLCTVHQQGGRRRARYFRCYEDSGAQRCGTIQCTGPTGQAWIGRNIRALDHVQQDAAAVDAAHRARESQQEAARRTRREVARTEPPAEPPAGRSAWAALRDAFTLPEGDD